MTTATTIPNISTGGATNPLKGLLAYGQSPWMDYIRRDLLTSGQLQKYIDNDGLRGMTSNPAIFEKAITGSNLYNDIVLSPDAKKLDANGIFEKIAIRDVQDACDIFKQVYAETKRRDGYVSLEVSPFLGFDTKASLAEARRLWKAVDRPNVMIKIPGTPEGLPAIRQALEDGININITLLFAQSAYEQVAEAFLSALEARVAKGQDISHIASVASFFVSRIDTLVDSKIDEKLKTTTDAGQKALLESLRGRVAIANARLTYKKYQELFGGPRWKALAAKGAQTQRLLWASTSTKNPNYRDVIYVEELIGRDTVDTIPPATYDAFRDHGTASASLEDDLEDAQHTMDSLADSGISMKAVTDQLLGEGVKIFVDAFVKLLDAVNKRLRASGGVASRQTWKLGPNLTGAVKASLDEWARDGKVRRLWARDASLWTGADEGRRLGWLAVTDDQLAQIDHLRQTADDVRAGGFTHAVLLGMGGTVLGAEALARTFGRVSGFPELHVLDSIDPARIHAVERVIDPDHTLVILASKSGSTLEPNILKQHFFERIRGVVGPIEIGRRFIAITDPGSKMQHLSEADGFRRIFFGQPSIGGRFSVLSDFGMVPAAIMGLDVARLLGQAEQMAHSCAASVPVAENPGLMLGVLMGVAARQGHTKVTLIASPGAQPLGTWIEQLVSASLGKTGGLLAIEGEPVG